MSFGYEGSLAMTFMILLNGQLNILISSSFPEWPWVGSYFLLELQRYYSTAFLLALLLLKHQQST